MPELTNAFRRIPKATYVPLQLDQQTDTHAARGGKSDKPSTPTQDAALLKFGYVRQLGLQTGEVDQAVEGAQRGRGQSSQGAISGSLLAALRSFEGSPMPSLLPSPSVFAKVPASALVAFGNALIAKRKKDLSVPGSKPKQAIYAEALISLSPGVASQQLNVSITATKNFEANAAAVRVGMLNLERLEMTPAGIERGELIATIPLAPKEKTSVIQKEWSVTSQEFTSIVTDSLEDYSETGVTENTELAQSTTSQATRNNQFNATGSVQGGFGNFVTASGSSTFNAQDQTSKSATDSRKDAVAVTRKASSRVKQSHKVTISTSTTSGSSETSTRTLRNPSATDPMRIDYFSLMRKWHVGLYRYGLRLTYDIVIPEPGAAMRETAAQLQLLQEQVSQQFTFTLKYSDITPDNWQSLSETFAAQLPPPPAQLPPQTTIATATGLPAPGDDDRDWHIFALPFEVPDGCWITDLTVIATVETGNGGSYTDHYFQVAGTPYYHHGADTDYTLNFTTGEYTPAAYRDGPTPPIGVFDFLSRAMGSQSISFLFKEASPATVGVIVATEPTPMAMEQWQSNVWNACYNAAQANYYTQQQAWNAQIQLLQDQINNVDTLTLRREENDEIMKGVLKWLLGDGFDFMPADVVALFKQNVSTSGETPDPLKYGVAFTGNDTALSPAAWSTVFQYEQMVRFINDAIEWENVVYFLYSYFWDVPESWEFIRSVKHPDLTRQGFLRSGSARVVLTVREGFEEAWVRFAEGGSVGATYNGPYLTIAQQIADYNNTNYPGIPPTTPGGGPLPDDGPQIATSSRDKLHPSPKAVTIEVDSSDGFLVGYSLIIDSYASGLQETQTILAVPDAHHLIVEMLDNSHDGSAAPIAIMQAGEKGLLIAEWFEYTPSSGTDIAVTSNLATIA